MLQRSRWSRPQTRLKQKRMNVIEFWSELLSFRTSEDLVGFRNMANLPQIKVNVKYIRSVSGIRYNCGTGPLWNVKLIHFF